MKKSSIHPAELDLPSDPDDSEDDDEAEMTAVVVEAGLGRRMSGSDSPLAG